MKRFIVFIFVLFAFSAQYSIAQDDLFAGGTFTKRSRNKVSSGTTTRSNSNNSSVRNNTNGSVSQRSNVSNYSLPDKFEYYYASADNTNACKINAFVINNDFVTVTPFGQIQRTPASARSFLFTGTSGNVTSTSHPYNNGEYWRYGEIALKKELHVYVRKDFSEVRHRNVVFNRRISKETYSKIMSKYYKNVEQINSQVPYSGFSDNSSIDNSTNSSVNSSVPSHRVKICRGCNGTGKCTVCKGTGKIVVNALNLTKIETCDVCHGGLTCRVCFGKGKFVY